MHKFLIVLFILITHTLFSQRYSFLTYNTAEGLPQSQVNAITQDKIGYLWVGTLGGLARFNGKDFVPFTKENGLLNNRITFLTFIDDILWIGHEGGVSRMEKGKITKWAFPKDYKTTAVSDIQFYRNKLLIMSNGAGLFEILNGKLQSIPLINDDFMRIRDAQVIDDILYLATRGGLIKTKDARTFIPLKAMSEYNISGIEYYNNQIYLTTFRNGLVRFSERDQKVIKVSAIDSTVALRNCVKDRNNALWVNSSNGVFRIKNQQLNLTLSAKNGLPMESVRVIFEDVEGNIWLGSEGKGLLRFPGENFVYYSQSDGLTSDLILCVNEDQDKNLWIGTYDKGIMKKDPSGNFTPFYLDNNNTVWCSIMDVDDRNWFGTEYGLVSIRKNGEKKVFFAENGLPGDKIACGLRLNSSHFYIGGSDGVSEYKGGKFSRVISSDIGTVRNMCIFRSQLILATDKGLYFYQKGKVTKFKNFSKTCYSVASDQKSIWVGTEEGLFEVIDDRIKQVVFSAVPASNFINFLTYTNHKLFVGTNNGLFLINEPSELAREVINFGIGEGVVNLETNINSGYVDRKGNLWFGTAFGLVTYRPNQVLSGFSAPKITLKSILVNFQTLDFKKYAKGIDVHGFPNSLKLPYNRNNLTIDLDGISLANHPGLKFQYWLEGLENGWSPLTVNSSVSYNGLGAGDYRLRVRCVDVRGKKSQELAFAFTVKQAFYKTWWFILIVTFVVIYSIFAVFRFRLLREREQNEREKLEYKSRLLTLEQKSLNASMNRHFIFNSLNSIQYFINTQDRLSANRFLTNFAKLIRKNLDSSEEGNLVSLQQEIERLELYLSLESMRFKDRFTYEIKQQSGLDTEQIIIPAMMLQPFIENSIIHGILPDESKLGRIEVDVYMDKDMLVIRIEDNGIGIEESMKEKENYEGDHKSQGTEITLKRIELLKKLSNTKIELIGPHQVTDKDGLIKGTTVTLKIQIENLEY